MALPFGMCWLFTLLLAGGCLSPHKGDIRARGQFLRVNPQISNQLDSGASMSINHDSVRPRVETQEAKRLQSHSEDTQIEADSEHGEDDIVVSASSAPVKKYEHADLEHQHPFGLLVKEHTQNKDVEGISFQTIRDLNVFIGSLKNSFLMPGKDLSRHFQTAREMMEKEMAYNSQTIKNEQSNTYRSNSVKEGSVHDEAGENEVWKEPTRIPSEQSEGRASHQMTTESLSDPVASALSLSSVSVYENPDSFPALFLRPHLAATDHALSNYESFANAGIPGKNTKLSIRPPDVDVEENWSTMHKLFKPIPRPFGKFSDGDSTQRGHVAASPVSPLSKTSQDLHYFSGFHKPSEDFEDHGRMSPQKVPLNSMRKSLYTSGNIYISEPQPKYSTRPALSVQTHQPPAVHHPEIIGSDPQRSYGYVGAKTSSPNEVQNVAFRGNHPVISHLLTLEPSSSLHGSSRHEGQHRGDTISVTHPSGLAARLVDYDEKSDPLNQNLIYTDQKPRQRTNKHYTTNLDSSGLHSRWQGLISPVNEGYLDFKSPSNLALTLDSNGTFLGLGSNHMFNNIETKNNVTDRVTPGMYDINGGRKYFRSSFMPFFLWKRGANVNKKPALMASRVPKLIYISKLPGFSLNSVFWGNKGYIKNPVDPKMSPLHVNKYKIKYRSRYVRDKTSLSKTQYTPHFIS